MKGYSKDPNNSFAHKFDRWFTPRFLSPNRQKRTLLALVLLLSIFVLLLLPSLNPEMERKKPLIFIVIAVALINLFFLIYENIREPEITVPPKALPPNYPHKSFSPFDPKIEETSKRLLRETTEQLESSSKIYPRRLGGFGDYNGNMKDSTLTRRLEFTRHHEIQKAPEIFSFGRPTGFNAQAPTAQAPANVFQPFVQANGPNIRSVSTARNVKEIAPPKQFANLRDSPTRYNYQAGDAGGRKANDYAYSTSPIRGMGNGRNQMGRPVKFLMDEKPKETMRDRDYMAIAKADAEDTLQALKIISEFPDWTKNCQRWFSGRLIPKILDENFSNIKELNRIIGYFDKRLYEYEFILKMDQGRTTENIAQKSFSPIITIDELLSYESSFRMGGTVWPSANLSNADIQKAHQDLTYLIQIRRRLEKYFEIDGFKPFEIRTHVLARLFDLRENITLHFRYDFEGIKRKYPTDMEILAHIFFTFLNVEAANQTQDKDKIYRNFVFKNTTNTIPSNISNENVYFSQRLSETYEPHYDIISGKNLWTAYPGKDNLFCAIVLFVWHIKTKKHGTLGFEESKTFKEFMQIVIP